MWCLSLKSVVWVRLKQIFLSVFSDISHSDCGNIQISKKKKKKSNVKVLLYRVTAITFQYEYDDVNIACTVWSL